MKSAFLTLFWLALPIILFGQWRLQQFTGRLYPPY